MFDEQYAQAFQFSELKIADSIADKDKVSIRWHGEGVHVGDFFNVPATYRDISISGQTLYRFDGDGKIAEVWQSWDMLGLFMSFGFNFKPLQLPSKDLEKHIKMASILSPRERACLKFFLQGKTSKETAKELFLSFRTIEYYFENIKDKLNCSTKRELYLLARIFEAYSLL